MARPCDPAGGLVHTARDLEAELGARRPFPAAWPGPLTCTKAASAKKAPISQLQARHRPCAQPPAAGSMIRQRGRGGAPVHRAGGAGGGSTPALPSPSLPSPEGPRSSGRHWPARARGEGREGAPIRLGFSSPQTWRGVGILMHTSQTRRLSPRASGRLVQRAQLDGGRRKAYWNPERCNSNASFH